MHESSGKTNRTASFQNDPEQFSFRNMSFSKPKGTNQSSSNTSFQEERNILEEIAEAENLDQKVMRTLKNAELGIHSSSEDEVNVGQIEEEKQIPSKEKPSARKSSKKGGSSSRGKSRRASVRRRSKPLADSDSKKQDSSVDSEVVMNRILARRGAQNPQMSRAIQEEQANSRRVIIRKLILEDFKSYGGRHEIGPFHHHFNAIIGPNGSGKSNLIDSMVFVFGKRASKLRLKNLSELIHRGYNNSGSDATKTCVEIEFVEAEGDSEIPGSGFSVSREVNKRGASKYRLNGHQVRIEKIEEHFMRRGIDLTNNRFIILQGEVEKISMMKPCTGDPDRPGMLEYLEELIGSDRHVESIQGLEKEMEIKNEERLRLGDLSKAAFQEVKCLSGEKDRAVEFIREEKREFQLSSLELQINKNKMVQYREESEQKKLEIKAKWDEFQTRIREINENKKKKQVELNELNVKRVDLEKEIKQIEVKLRASEEGYEQFNSEEQKLEERKEKLEEEKKRYEKDQERAQKELLVESDLIPEAEEKIEGVEAELSEVLQKIEKEEKKKRGKIMQLKEMEGKYSREVEKISRDEGKAEREHKELMTEEASIKKEVEDHREKLREQLENKANFESNIENCSEECSKLEKVLKELSAHHEVLSREVGSIDQTINKKRMKKRELEEKLKKYDQNKKNRRYSQRILEWLIDMQRDGRVGGILGRLGDLGTVDAQYDVAASTATGMLDFIVVDSYESAKKCIMMLKQHKVGRASFVTLDRLKGYEQAMHRRANYPRGAKRLFDLIGKKLSDILLTIKMDLWKSGYILSLYEEMVDT